jgi:cyanophycin synthetase
MPGPPPARSAAPVVVKPQDGNQGKGVAVNLTTREQVAGRLRRGRKISDDVLVERYLPGQDSPLLVVGDKLIAAARREPPLVIGDGVHTVRNWSTRSTAIRAAAKATPPR